MRKFLLEGHSLRAITLVGALICAIVPVIVLAIGSNIAVRSWAIDNEVARARRNANNIADVLNQSLTAQQRTIETLGASTKYLSSFSVDALSPLLQTYHANRPVIDRLLVSDLNGRIIAADPSSPEDGRSSIGTSIADRDYFKQALAANGAIITREIVVGKTTGKPLIIIAAPAFSPDGQVAGVIASTIEVSDVKALVDRAKYGRTGSAVVATENGIVVAHNNVDLVLKRTNFSKQPVWQTIADSDEGDLPQFADETGVQRLGGFATVPSTGWKIWVSRSYDEISGDISSSQSKEIIWVGLSVVLAVLGAFLLVRYVIRPIDSLRQTAERVAGGAFDERAEESGPTEVTALATSLNRMADKLQHTLEAERAGKERLEKSVEEFAGLASRVTAGDLRARVSEDGDGSLGRLGSNLNRMTASLGELVREIRAAADSVSSAGAEILAATSQQVSATAEEATAVRQTAATVAEVKQAAEVSARKTRLVADMAQKMAKIAEDGRDSVEESIKGSDSARQRMETLAERILTFSEQAEAIAEINATVSELAEQSNLLAVNAGIEAAKAGEAGKGFAVVATEVKALAERCKEATVQVRRIVVEIQKSAQSTVMAAEQGVKAAESGATIAARSGDAIGALATSVVDASQAAQQIMAAATQQEAGMDQIALAIRDIEQSSAQTVAAMKQVERATLDLNNLAQRLSETIQTSVVD
ncbi:MAG: methyl-accepting chemotaxis protein [Rhodospirillaceae bacterium]|nr:MAG: methyl-accepting chemotaxis protein [Rhodospirillaceae bacterium]